MATTSFVIDGVRGRTSSGRRFVVVRLVPGRRPPFVILYRTDDASRAVARAHEERAHVVDTAGQVKVRRCGSSTWEPAS